MTTRMTAQRLGRLVADGDAEGVRAAVADAPRLLSSTVERDGTAGWTPLHLAVAGGHAEVVRVLAEAGADLDARTEHARTPLHTALEFSPGLVALLRELGAPLDAASAAFLDDAETLGRELDGGARLVDPVTGVDLLVWAAYGGAGRTVRLLLDRGADVEARDTTWTSTPLEWAAVGSGEQHDGDWVETVQVLLRHGASIAGITLDPDEPKQPSAAVAGLLRAHGS